MYLRHFLKVAHLLVMANTEIFWNLATSSRLDRRISKIRRESQKYGGWHLTPFFGSVFKNTHEHRRHPNLISSFRTKPLSQKIYLPHVNTDPFGIHAPSFLKSIQQPKRTFMRAVSVTKFCSQITELNNVANIFLKDANFQ